MKKSLITVIASFCLVAFGIVAVNANPKLLTQHKAITNGDKKVASCNDCHNAVTKLEKKKGAAYKPLLKSKSCAGKGCHK